MADYKELYLSLFRATERAIETLVEAQRRCEEMVLNAPRENLTPFPASREEIRPEGSAGPREKDGR